MDYVECFKIIFIDLLVYVNGKYDILGCGLKKWKSWVFYFYWVGLIVNDFNVNIMKCYILV